MYFTNIFLFGLVATATALPQKRGGRRKCSSVFPSTTGTSDRVSTTPILSSSSSIVVTPTSSDPFSTPIVSTPVSSSATPSTSSEVASTPVSSESSATTPGTTPPASTTPESSTVASSTPGSSTESSTPIASSTDSSSTVPSSTPSSTSESSTPVESSTVPSSTPSSTSESSTPVASSTVSSSTIASTTSIASTTAASTTVASTTAASTGPARPRPTAAGDIPAGVEYHSCTFPGQVGLAFAQGPYAYTAEALDLLDASGFKATFFLNGNNWGSIYDYSSVVQRMYTSGHQIGSNTWNNADLSTLDKTGIENELYQLEDALRSIVGVYPTYLLPPNGNTNQLVRDTAASLGYKIIKPDIITYDEEHQSDIQTAISNFDSGLDAGGSIALVHDVYQATVESMLPAMIQSIQQRGLTAVTLAQCFARPASYSYSTAP